jgi:beta-galactosidase
MVVWAEIPFVDQARDEPDFYENTKQQMKELIRQNYNHPSIITWGIGNEVHIKEPNPLPLFKQLSALVHEEDSTRLSTYASCHGDKSPLNFQSDLVSFNKYYGWYYGELDDFAAWMDRWHAQYPGRKLGVSEYGVGANTTHHQENPPPPGRGTSQFMPEEFQNTYHEIYWAAIKARDYLWATHIWNMFDFASDHRDFGSKPGINLKGMVTHDRKIKKDAFFFYKANWSAEPVVYITSRRADNRSNANAAVKVYSNGDSVELFVNGKSQGSKTPSDIKICEWTGLDISNGTRVKAVADKDGKTVTDNIRWNEVP